MSETKVPYITKNEIETYLALEEKRKSFARQAQALEKQADKIEERIRAFILAEGGKEKSVPRSGFVLAIKTAKGSVPWKDAFIDVAGQKEAERRIALAPRREFVSVERMAEKGAT